MDLVNAWHKGIEIELRPVELQQGGWKADFTLTEHIGSQVISTPYEGKVTFPTREIAKVAALNSAYSIIDEEHPTVPLPNP